MADTANICQYWSVDKDGEPTEPAQCSNWSGNICTYRGSNNESAPYAPNCNLIGTQIKCTAYDGAGGALQKRCILPDPDRHVINRKTGRKWATPASVDVNGEVTGDIDFSQITGYNNGECDSFGTIVTCSGYSPWHMQFGSLVPSSSDLIDSEGFTTIEGFDVRVPLGYEIYNLRALLGRCYWWAGDPYIFSVSTDDNYGRVIAINSGDWKCSNTKEWPMVIQYSKFKFDNEVHMYRAPCNGCKPECLHYTNPICWEYCIDSKMRHGDKVLAEQILELRYYLKKDSWTREEYEDSFKYPDIYAWAAPIKYTQQNPNAPLDETKYIIPSTRVYQNSFEIFSINRSSIPLTDGLQAADDNNPRYPTLVGELKTAALAPIIRNKFSVLDNKNVFEVSDLDHSHITLVGDVFYYNESTYAVNLDDPDISLVINPVRNVLLAYDNLSEIKQHLEDDFNSFHASLETALTTLVNRYSDKIGVSSISNNVGGFYIAIPTVFGENNLFVFNKGSGEWEFDKISVIKLFCGGVIGQTSFSVEGDGKDVSYLPSYESNFNSYLNNNGSVGFSFFPFTSVYGSATVDYVYNDFVKNRLPTNPMLPPDYNVYDMTYKMYKVAALSSVVITVENMSFFGNAGYALLTIPDPNKKLHNVFKAWVIEDTITLNLPSGEDIAMEIYNREENITRLENNQIIIRPKNIDDFRAACNGAVIFITNVYTYERHSYEVPIDGVVIDESFVNEDDVVNFKNNESISGAYDNWTIHKFGNDALNMSIVFRGITGYVKGQTKTKLLVWIRQPYCQDIEIMYGWYAGYQSSVLLPEHNCYGPTGFRVSLTPVYFSYTPPCGDHDLSYFSGKGPMWYPYDECEGFDRYNITGVLTEWDIRIMEPFWEGAADPPHGSHDIRMLGPADHFGRTIDSHASLWKCTCDWSFANYDKQTHNMFSGYARYRGGMSYTDKLRCVQNGGDLPRFGNVPRGFLRSFRSGDNIDYYYFDEVWFTRKQKWVPMPEFYTDLELSSALSNRPYLSYSSNDYYDDRSMFIDQMGLLLVDNIENIDISENMLYEYDGSLSRFRFDDVFDTHDSSAGIYYPYPAGSYLQQRSIGGNLVDVISWYTYRDFPGAVGEGEEASDYSIQWAWREKWRTVDRNVDGVTGDTILDLTESDAGLGSHPLFPSHRDLDDYVVAPIFDVIISEGGKPSLLKGRLWFLDINYPDYQYDYQIKEHRLVRNEGPAAVKFTGSYDDGFTICLTDHISYSSDGPTRTFDSNGNWISNALYDVCTVSPWVDTVSIFDWEDSTHFSPTPQSDRTIRRYDETGTSYNTYYHRGLAITPNVNNFDRLPGYEGLANIDEYEISISELPFFTDGTGVSADDIETNAFFPAELVGRYLGFEYESGSGSGEITFTLKFSTATRVPSIVLDYKLGAEGGGATADTFVGTLYCIPGIMIYGSTDGSSYTEIYNNNVMILPTFNQIVSDNLCYYRPLYNDSLTRYKYFRIKLRYVPNVGEKNNTHDFNLYDEVCTKLIHISALYIYSTTIVDAVEELYTYERKFNISYGKHGDFPPHGYENTGSLLYVNTNDRSTVYQMDTVYGVTGMPNSSGELETMNKCRGRLLKACKADKTIVEGPKDLYSWEGKQKEIFDDVSVKIGSTDFTARAFIHPNITTMLNAVNMYLGGYWSCSFSNTLVAALLEVPKFAPYSPCGHFFTWDFPNIHREDNCGRFGSIFWRSTEDVFDYVFRHYCSDQLEWTSMDVLVAYFRGVGNLLLNPFVFQQRDEILRSRYVSTYRSSVGNETELQMQEAAHPLY